MQAVPAVPAVVTDQVIVDGEIGRFVDAHLSRFSDYGYSFSVVVAEGDRIWLQKAYGPGLSPASVFNAASVAKQFTATAILKLASEGKLALNDPITRYFPEAAAEFREVTIDHLLAHTSGIRDDYAIASGFRTPKELKAHVFSRRLASAPGAEWEYSNFGYSLLALVIERASGQPFKTYVRSALFGPAGLRETGFRSDSHWPEGQRPRASGGLRPEDPRVDTWGFGLGGSDVVTSPADLFRWIRAVEAGRVLPESWRALMDRPMIDVFGGLKYGRGWWNRRVKLAGKERLNIWHSGLEEVGFSAWVNRYPAERIVTIFNSSQGFEGQPLREMLNSAGGPSVLEKLIFGGDVYLPPRVVPAAVEPFAGQYRIDATSWLEIRAEPPFLDVIPHGQAAFDALLPSGTGDKAAEVLATATKRTGEILEDLKSGSRRALQRYRASKEPVPSDFFAPFDSYEVLGSAPIYRISAAGPGRLATFVIVRRNGQSENWRVQWSGGEAGFIYRSEAPVLPLFRATGEGIFANFHPLVRGSAYLHFAGDDLITGKVKARRLHPG